jgi:hypothetical protein
MDSIYTVLISIVTTLGGASAWRFYEKRALKKEKDDEFIRNDCKDRITKLEALLTEASNEKSELRNMIVLLTAQVAELKVRVEFLTSENAKLLRDKKKNTNAD